MSEPVLKSLPVLGYQDQSTDKVDLVNEAKIIEEIVLRQLDRLQEVTAAGVVSTDPRWMALAQTYLQIGFMCMNRAVFMPGRINPGISEVENFIDEGMEVVGRLLMRSKAD